MILITILLFSIPPRGAPPELWQKYKSSIDLTKQTFKCFDGSKTISLSQFNDNYPDCKDSSDEPGTSIDSGTKFYCKNATNVCIIYFYVKCLRTFLELKKV